MLGSLTDRSSREIVVEARNAWNGQIEILQLALQGLEGYVLFEYGIPRMGRRIDVLVIIGAVVFVLEFKVGESRFDRYAREQVWDYALDLKNFHAGSHSAPIVPILIATRAVDSGELNLQVDADQVYRPILIGQGRIRDTLDLALSQISAQAVDVEAWLAAPYRPTPTIIEAARALYSQHSVEAITRHDADAKNLQVTSKRVEEIVDSARARAHKVICFVTGVPGAGKTLIGLNVATRHRKDPSDPTHAVYLSGNGPLVAVLREALTRDEVERRKAVGEKAKKKDLSQSVKAFIQNVHHFRDEALVNQSPPADHVVIFDEAQRAWNAQQTANFMRRKRGQSGFTQSEPEFLLSYMDRHQGWAAVICLVGGGQEINTGEAGIGAWLEAVRLKYPAWHMYISSRLVESEYRAGEQLAESHGEPNIHFEDSLHLAVSMRSFRAENVSHFVKAVLDCDVPEAQRAFDKLKASYPVVITRDLNRAKQWVRNRARGSERYGVVASSKAMRLKPHAIDVRFSIDPVQWFLNSREDTRSSYYLEDAATEFQVQGLELDWVCVTWDADLRHTDKGWKYHDFRGSAWCNIKKPENREYLRNAYRVLLTRARQGMVVFIPPGDPSDPTRPPEYYDSTYQYLVSLGLEAV